MAGIGINLNRIFSKRTVTSALRGIITSMVYTIVPMLVIMGSLLVMYWLLGFDTVGYVERELFSCTVLYIFIFSLLFSSAFNSTLSKYIADKIFERQYNDIKPCMMLGLLVKLGLSTLVSVPFYIYEILVGKVEVYYVFTSYMGYMALTLVFAVMLYGVVIKKFSRISVVFFLGSLATVFLSCLFRFVFHFSVTYSMLLALTIGFWTMATLMMYTVFHHFPNNTNRYRPVLIYFKKFWRLIASDFLYIFGLFAHNFVFWTVPWRLEVVNTYVCNQPYDMATCLAMFTNISATVLFISKVEMHFFDRYSDFNSAIIGGDLDRIQKAKSRMMDTLATQMQDLVHVQFAISVLLFLVLEIALPLMGFAGMTMEIYPLMAVGYFISFLMYSNILFLQYFTDYTGSMLTALIFAVFSLVGGYFSTLLTPGWYGLGYTVGALFSYIFSYLRLRWMEKNLYSQVFCTGSLLDIRQKDMPSSNVYERDAEAQLKNRNAV